MKMDSTKQIKRNLKKIKISFCAVVFLIGGCTMFSSRCSEFEQNLKNTCQVNDSTYKVAVFQLTDIDFDTLCIIEGQRFPDEVEKIISVKYDDVLPEDARQFIFLKNKQIIKQFNSKCSIGFMMDRYKGYLKISHTAKLDITRKEYKKNPKKPEEGNYYSYWATLAE